MDDDSPDPARFLPLTPPVFHVLCALADRDRHGYAVMQEVEERTGGRVRLSAGTLYGVVKRLVEEGLIAEADRRPAPGEDSRRRYYRLTELGRRVARAEAERLEGMLAVARSKDLLGGPEPA